MLENKSIASEQGPSYRTNQLNGRSVVYFDDNVLQTSPLRTPLRDGDGSYTYFIVYGPYSDSNYYPNTLYFQGPRYLSNNAEMAKRVTTLRFPDSVQKDSFEFLRTSEQQFGSRLNRNIPRKQMRNGSMDYLKFDGGALIFV